MAHKLNATNETIKAAMEFTGVTIIGAETFADTYKGGKAMSLLSGFGWYIWQIAQCGTPQEIADLANINDVNHLLIKIADGIYDYNKANGDPAKQLTQAAQTLAITVWGWQYVYLSNPIAEADKAYQRIQETGCTGFVIDAEGEWKEQLAAQVTEDVSVLSIQVSQWMLDGAEDKAEQYLSRLRALVGPDFPLALSSYRYPSYHPEFPWEVARSYVNLDMPQVYWEQSHDPVYQLNKSYNEFMAMTPKLPYLPSGAAYQWNGWEPTVADVSGFIGTVQGLGLPGYNFWSYQHCKRDLPAVWAMLMPFEDTPGDMPNYVMAESNNVRIRYSQWGAIKGYADSAIAYKVLDQSVDPQGNGYWYSIGNQRWIAGWCCKTYD